MLQIYIHDGLGLVQDWKQATVEEIKNFVHAAPFSISIWVSFGVHIQAEAICNLATNYWSVPAHAIEWAEIIS